MTFPDLRTLVWLVPLAVVLVFAWLFGADSCLDNEIRNRLGVTSPSITSVLEAEPPGTDVAVIDNPYGLTPTCHDWPDAWDHTISLGTLGVIALLVGFLSARNFQQRARIRAAVIMFVTVFLAAALNQWAYLPGNLGYFEWAGYGALFLPLLLMLVVLLAAAMIAWFAAALTLKWRPRG